MHRTSRHDRYGAWVPWFEALVDSGIQFVGGPWPWTPLAMVSIHFAGLEVHWFEPNTSETFKSTKPVVMLDMDSVSDDSGRAAEVLEEFLSVLAYTFERPVRQGSGNISGFPRSVLRPITATRQPNQFEVLGMRPPKGLNTAADPELKRVLTLHKTSLCAVGAMDAFLPMYQALEIATNAAVSISCRKDYVEELANSRHLGKAPPKYEGWWNYLTEIRNAIAHPKRRRADMLHIDRGSVQDQHLVQLSQIDADKLLHRCVDETWSDWTPQQW